MRTCLSLLSLLGFTLLLPNTLPAHAQRLPPGFEDLADGHAERVEVRAFGRSAGLWPVWVTLQHVQLEQPMQLLAALGLSDEAQVALLPAVTAPLPRDSHLACLHAQPQPGCGWRAAPQDATTMTAIFDEAESVLLLFPSSQWLPAADGRARFHQVSEQARNALVHQQVMQLSGGDGELAFNLHGRAALGVGRAGHLGGSWNHARWRVPGLPAQTRTDVDELYYRHDLWTQHYLQVGRIDRRNLSSPLGGQFGLGLLPLVRMQGLRVGSTLAYVDTDVLDDALAVNVLLGRDARVDVFDGERLLQTFFLPAGAHQLDTRLFPAGSYLLTLRIHEDGRFVRSESAPFQRSIGNGYPGLQWFVQGGWQDESGVAGSSASVLQAGLRLPVGAASVGLGISHSQGVATQELRTGLRRAIGAVDVHADLGVLAASDGARGEQMQLSVRHFAAWNLYRQRMRGDACGHRTERPAGTSTCADALSASVSLPVLEGHLHVAHNRRRSAHADATRSLQSSYTRTRVWRGMSVGTRVSLWQQRSDGASSRPRDRGLQLSLTLTRLVRAEGRIRLQRAGAELRQRSGQAPDRQLRLGQSWREEQDDSARSLTSELALQPGGHADALLAGELRRPWGQGGATLALARTPEAQRLSWSAHHSSAMALSTQGIYWGAADGADAGVVVAVDPEADTDPSLRGPAAEVQAAGSRRHTLRVGERRLLPISGYQRHHVRVQDVSADTPAAVLRASAASTELKPFLPPGRVMLVPVAVAATYTYLGTAQDEAGEALPGAAILNAAVPGLGEEGGFLVEFDQRQPWLYLLHGERLLRCPLQVRERRIGLLRVGAVTCAPLPHAQLPDAIAAQPRVQHLLSARLPVVTDPAAGAP
ncbi:CS1-pili formation C-terminal domain-containing protein [Stenotrophomonas sp.]|uniref:CS1-pili formation C-terminal domain-containing protein n=1 Tax=Stenotrophomonas sp. TaxID=69392 RepID=UPI00289DFF0A|nr:CS1-pili formation C-terminal domain-containing protein [Stenotrophomonas sp.]